MAGMRRWSAIGGVVVVVIGVALAVHFFSPGNGKPLSASTNGDALDSNSGGARQESDAAATTERAGNQAKRASMTQSSAPLPPLDAPLTAIVRDLKPRAEAGDARALCRLAVEYRYCADLQDRMQMIESGVARAQQNAESGRRSGWRSPERMASAFEETNRLYQHCEGVETPPSTEIVRYMREAASAGHPQAASYYATGDMFDNSDMLDNLPELALYRDNAESIALAAVAQGDLRAAWELARAYASDPDDRRRPLLAQAVDPQPATALSLLYALRSSIGNASTAGESQTLMPQVQERIASLEQRLSPADVARARSQPAKIGGGAGGADMSGANALQRLSGAMSSRGRGGDWSRDICD
jgi:hypothetical protein